MPRPPADVQSWLASHDPLRIVPLIDPVIETVGHAPRSTYAETYWLPVIGPSALWALRRLSARVEAEPAGVEVARSRRDQRREQKGGVACCACWRLPVLGHRPHPARRNTGADSPAQPSGRPARCTAPPIDVLEFLHGNLDSACNLKVGEKALGDPVDTNKLQVDDGASARIGRTLGALTNR